MNTVFQTYPLNYSMAQGKNPLDMTNLQHSTGVVSSLRKQLRQTTTLPLYFGALGKNENCGLLFTYDLKLPVDPGEEPTMSSGVGEASTSVAELLKRHSKSDIAIVVPGFKRIHEYVKRHNWPKLKLSITVPSVYHNFTMRDSRNITFEVYKGQTAQHVPVYVLSSEDIVYSNGSQFKLHEIETYKGKQFDFALPIVNEAFLNFAEYLDRSNFNHHTLPSHAGIHDYQPKDNDHERKNKIHYWFTNTALGYLLNLKRKRPELDDVGVVSLVHSIPIASNLKEVSDTELLSTLYGHFPSAYPQHYRDLFHYSPAASAVFNSDALVVNQMHLTDSLTNHLTGEAPGSNVEFPYFNPIFAAHKATYSFDYHVPQEFSIRKNPFFNFMDTPIHDVFVYKGSWSQGTATKENLLSTPTSVKKLGFYKFPKEYKNNIYNCNPGEDLSPVLSAHLNRFKTKNKVALQKLLGLEVNPKAPLFTFASRLDPIFKNAEFVLLVMDHFLETHPDAQFVLSSHKQPKPDAESFKKALDILQEKYPTRFRYVDGRQEVYQLVLGASTYHIMPSNSESFGLSDIYAAGMGTPNIASPVEGILTKFHDPNKPLISARVKLALKQGGDKQSYRHYYTMLRYGQSAIFIEPYNNVELLQYKFSFPGLGYAQQYRTQAELPPVAQDFCAKLEKALEEGYQLYTKTPNKYVQLVHNNIKLTNEMFNEKITAERLEKPIHDAVQVAYRRQKQAKRTLLSVMG